ncbi:hypothetical protein B0920_04805 [Massilia sp. KIM]|uniref:thioredoxin family protein n=1 Tax=Massilia sp. KIM TaxID=1955422 RepID=UPI00098FDCE4|nr:thioredoxin family protein [Massilia sp. KIM]OON62758.1 hypothetical protein B0920_04805 [Massilia sp. KIM]
MKRHSLAALGGIAVLGAAAALAVSGPLAAGPALLGGSLPVKGSSPGFAGATTWLNGTPLNAQQLKGKVVLVDFWTYSCINCIRTFPYLRAWADKYRDQGLVVVGVHTPEFKFEQDLSNVNAALARYKIDFPVAVDSDYRIWEAWNNQYWPAFYLVDAKGKIRFQHFGEGDYAKVERAIQSLLVEANGKPVDESIVNPSGAAEQMAPDLANVGSGEAYLGYRKAQDFRSPERLKPDSPRDYTVGKLNVNQWGLFGQWNVGAERAVVAQPGAGVAHQFSARDLHLVMGPGAPGRKVRIKVTVDGRAPGADHGADVDAEGNGVVTETRLHQLVRQSGKVGQRRFEVRFLDAGAQAYAFTFG